MSIDIMPAAYERRITGNKDERKIISMEIIDPDKLEGKSKWLVRMAGGAVSVPVPEKVAVGLMLAFVGGFLDTYTYLLHGGVFANAQTGNMVLFGIHMAQGEWGGAWRYLFPVASFALGTLAAQLLDEKAHRVGRLRWRQVALLAETGLLFAIGWGLFQANHHLVACLVAFVCAMQVSSFKKIHGANFATTMCTGNLRSATECLTRFLLKGNRRDGFHSLVYLLVIGVFCLGAFAGVFLVGWLGGKAVWVCCLLLVVVFFYLF